MKTCTLFKAVSSVALIAGMAQFSWGAPRSHRVAQVSADSVAKAASSSAAMASTNGESAGIRNGTRISAELMSNIDARTAKPGDKVVARVTKNVKQRGRIVVRKGDKLIGHITSVKTAANNKASSAIGVRFDRLAAGRSTTQLNAVLTSVLSVSGFNNEGSAPMQPPSMPAPVAAPAGGGGGLMGGVDSTVGSAVGGVGGAVGAVSQSTLGANSAFNLVTPARQIHLQTYASANQSAGMDSILTTRKGDLRLGSGTRMKFRVDAGANAQTGK